MNYVLIDSLAINEIINSRQYQSTEFEQGRILVAFIRGTIPKVQISHSAVAIKNDGGGFILNPAQESINYLVFDLEEMPALLQLDDVRLLLAFQKTLRFVKKLWEGLSASKHERVISEAKAIVFPYPINFQTALRLSIDRSPDAKRRVRREKGQAYLVYKFSDNEGDGPSETARLTNFRKASEGRNTASTEASSFLAQQNESASRTFTSIAVTCLSPGEQTRLQETGLDNWRRWLTSAQLNFVDAPLGAPHRIEGPAGTGKTLCLVLKAINTLSNQKCIGNVHRSLFVTHSQATKTSIENLFSMNGGEEFLFDLAGFATKQHVISVTTLHELCASLLRQDISTSELIDRDAYESKLTQKLYSIEAVEKIISRELYSHRAFLSEDFMRFLDASDRWAVAEMLQHEISVQIKGRAEQDLSKYRKLPALKFGLPVQNDGDRAFVFLMYEEYQRTLEDSAQFDTDDVVLSVISQLATPIWRRRRTREGYDSIFIDETHLFNLNELSVFHKLTRSEALQPIAYSVDRSQALGDRGWTNEAFESAFDPQGGGSLDSANVKSIFRCSPEIIDLAFSITSSGATLFTNFHNPLVSAVSAFSADDERKCSKPLYLSYPSDGTMLESAFQRADALAKDMSCSRSDIAIIVFGDDLLREILALAIQTRKSVETIKSRGDIGAVNRAKLGNKYVVSAPEFVGGLEFAGVVLVGVDGGRVPPLSSGAGESQAFLNYAAHQRLYVAVTRAKYRVEMLGTRARGLSSTLSNARHSDLIEVVDLG